MRLRNSFLFVTGAFLSQSALAVCTVDPDSQFGGANRTTLTIPGYTFYVDAGAPVSDTPLNYENSTTQNVTLSFKDCEIGEAYGKTALPPLAPTGKKNYFTTSVEGISVRPRWNNGAQFGHFPSNAAMTENRFNYPPASFFQLEFVKTSPRLKLTDPNGDVVLSPGTILRNWVTSDTAANYGQLLNIGEIRVISIPNCTIDGPKTVNFGQLGERDLISGVEKNLDFSLRCATDYGSYSASASLITASPNADGTIPVTDSAGNNDRLKIQITDSNNRNMPADDSAKEDRAQVADEVPVNYSWKATLMKNGNVLPEEGNFTAKAEILLVVN
ncbi:fimbrial protein [Candidatus Pantoea floridensis]|uniref:Fimbrial protein n=1 Tax=Candidatus Pantoea floridensis TaxID=1938870 RepID=A0A286BQB6_9GAMM|nr:fimbrial protein [Pantoea floridensis]PIF22984.1 fimbrial protein [Enterobacteriaceae bacterium JKS000233]SOD36340.1 Fimbrial protein [Pantoea floridensis]